MKSGAEDVTINLCGVDPKSAKNGGEGHKSIGTVFEEERELTQELANPVKNWWNTFFIISCAFAVFNDPFFCYIYAIDDLNKCITMDRKLAGAYVISRTVTDIIYLIDLLVSKCGCCCCCCCCRRTRMKKTVRSCLRKLFSTLCRIYVFLPIAQILVSRMIRSINPVILCSRDDFLFFTALQYALRIYYIYGSLKRRSVIDIARVERWLRPVLGFVPFILAAHLFGAFWYFLATQKQIQCWDSTRDKIDILNRDPIRRNVTSNVTLTVYIVISSSSRGPVACALRHNETYNTGQYKYNISQWDDLCPVKNPEPKTYDFGIYLYALQSNVASSSKPLLQRELQSFWWALRNMSSFGSNLTSSMDTLEIIFSTLISISGMALFLVYLNARVQESQERSKKLLLEAKKESMKPDVDLWLSKNNLSNAGVTKKKKKTLRTVIMDNIDKLEENSDLDVQNILSILPLKEKQRVTCSLFFASVKNVSTPSNTAPVIQTIDKRVLKEICQHLVLVTYTEDSYIVKEGKPLGKMLLITQGSAVTYSHGSSSNKWLKKGDFYGDKLLDWAFKSLQYLDLPISTENVIAQEKVDAFAIRAGDLKTIFFKFWWLFSTEVNGSELEQWKHLAASSVQAFWRHRQAKSRYVQKPRSWFRRRAKGTPHWNRFFFK